VFGSNVPRNLATEVHGSHRGQLGPGSLLVPDCGAAIGQRHNSGCDVERCPYCGWAAIGCQHFDPNDARRQVWTGKWPGEEDCERLDFFVNLRSWILWESEGLKVAERRAKSPAKRNGLVLEGNKQ
jgi:hypothetical protein